MVTDGNQRRRSRVRRSAAPPERDRALPRPRARRSPCVARRAPTTEACCAGAGSAASAEARARAVGEVATDERIADLGRFDEVVLHQLRERGRRLRPPHGRARRRRTRRRRRRGTARGRQRHPRERHARQRENRSMHARLPSSTSGVLRRRPRARGTRRRFTMSGGIAGSNVAERTSLARASESAGTDDANRRRRCEVIGCLLHRSSWGPRSKSTRRSAICRPRERLESAEWLPSAFSGSWVRATEPVRMQRRPRERRRRVSTRTRSAR